MEKSNLFIKISLSLAEEAEWMDVFHIPLTLKTPCFVHSPSVSFKWQKHSRFHLQSEGVIQ